MKDQISFIQTNNTQKFHNEEIRDKIVFQITIGNNQGGGTTTTTTTNIGNNDGGVNAPNNISPTTNTTIVQISEESIQK